MWVNVYSFTDHTCMVRGWHADDVCVTREWDGGDNPRARGEAFLGAATATTLALAIAFRTGFQGPQ